MNKFYESEQLKDKIKDRGSLYGVPSTEFSQEKELEDLIQRMPAMITKPNSIFDKGELEAKYRIFLEKTKALQYEEDMRRERDEAFGLKSPGKTKSPPSNDEDFFTGSMSPSKFGANV